jgi:hypothetical protein
MVEEASVASTGGGAPTTDREDYEDTLFSQAEASQPDGSQADQDSLLVSAFQPEIELNRQVLAAVEMALSKAGPTSHMSPERVSSLCDLVTATLHAERGANGGLEDDSDSSLMAVVVRGVLEKYAGEALADCSRRVFADLENVLYDEMIFERIVTQARRTMLEAQAAWRPLTVIRRPEMLTLTCLQPSPAHHPHLRSTKATPKRSQSCVRRRAS